MHALRVEYSDPSEARPKTAEDRFAQIMGDIPGWCFAGLMDGSGAIAGITAPELFNADAGAGRLGQGS